MSVLENVVFAYLVVGPLAGSGFYLAQWALLLLADLMRRRVASWL